MNIDNGLLELDESALQPSEPIEADFTNPLGIVKSDKWRFASPYLRQASVDRAFTLMVDKLEEDKSAKISLIRPNGEAYEAPLFDPTGGWSKDGKEYLERSRQFLEAAAVDEDGGVFFDPDDSSFKAAPHLSPLLERQKNKSDPFKNLNEIKQEVESQVVNGKSRQLTWEVYVEEVNKDKDPDSPAAIDPDNQAMKDAFESRMRLSSFDPESLGDKPFKVVEGVPIFNPKFLKSPSVVEKAIEDSDLSAADKRMALINFKDQYNKIDAGIITQQSDALDSEMHKAPFLALADMVGIERNTLNDRFVKHLEDPKNSMYSFIKENEAEFSDEKFGWADKLSSAFWNASRSTGIGALYLLTGGQSKPVLDLASASARADASAFEGMGGTEHYRVLGMDFTNKGFYDMAGQVMSIIATAGGGAMLKGGVKGASAALGSKALAAATAEGASIGASRAAVAKGADFVGKQMAMSEAKILAATKALAPNTAKNLVIKALRDPSAYIGGLQASGMSFGSTYNEVLERTGDTALALKQANIQAISDGLSAFIATSVFNRIAPGAEKMLSGVEGSMSGSLISRIKYAKAARSSVAKGEVVKVLEETVKDEATRKLVVKGFTEIVDRQAKYAGLKGFGPAVGVVSEFFEEATDTAISDVFQAILDDSKTWTDDVWENIGEKFSEYMAAGVMGAFGGGLGESVGSVSELSKKSREHRAELVKTYAEKTWQRIKGNLESFDPVIHQTAAEAGVDKNVVEWGEYLANSPDSPEVKAKRMVDEVLTKNFTGDYTQAFEDWAKEQPDSESQKPNSGPQESSTAATNAPVDDDATEDGDALETELVDEAEEILKSLITIPEGREIKKGMVVQRDDKPLKIGKLGTLTPISISGVNNAAAEVVSPDGTKRIVKAGEASELLRNNAPSFMRGKHVAQANSFDETSKRYEEQIENEWTTKQSNEGNANRSKKPVTRKTGSRTGPASKEGRDRRASSDGPSEQARSDGASSSTEPVADKATIDRVAKMEIADVSDLAEKAPLGTKETPERIAERAAAKERLVSEGLWDEYNDQPVRVDVGEHMVDPTNGTVGVEVRSKLNGKKLLVEARIVRGKTVWTIVPEDSKSPGTYSGKVNFESDTGHRDAAIKALGSKTVANIEASHRFADKSSNPDDAARSIEAIERELKKNKDARGKHVLVATKEESPAPEAKEPPTNENDGTLEEDEGQGLQDEEVERPKIPSSISRSIYREKTNLQDKSREELQEIVDKAENAGNEKAFDDRYFAARILLKESFSDPSLPSELPLEAASPASTAKSKKKLGAVQNFTVDRKLATGGTDRIGGVWESTSGRSGESPETFFYTPPKGKKMAGNLSVIRFTDSENDVLVLTGFDNGRYQFKRVNLAMSLEAQGKGLKSEHFDRASQEWESTRLTEINARLIAALPKLLGTGKVSQADFNKAFNAILGIVAPNVNPNDVVFTKLPGSSFTRVEVRTVSVPKERGLGAPFENDSGLTPNLGPDVAGNKEYGDFKKDSLGSPIVVFAESDKTPPNKWVPGRRLTEEEAPAVLKAGESTQSNIGGRVTFTEADGNVENIKGKVPHYVKNDGTLVRADRFDAAVNQAPALLDSETMEEELRPIMLVDKDKMLKVLRSHFDGYNSLGSDIYKGFVANEVGRQIAAWIDEEQIHRIALDRLYTNEELDQFFSESLEASGQTRQLRTMLLETVAERMGIDYNRSTDGQIKEVIDEMDDAQKRMIVHEMLRKMLQLSISGTTTEMQNEHSRFMLHALNKSDDNKKGFNKVKTALAMVRRYFERVRNALFMRRLRGQMTEHQKMMLGRLDSAYSKANLQGDVDNISTKAVDHAAWIHGEWRKNFEERVNKVILDNKLSNSLTALKEIVRSQHFAHLGIEDIVELDTKEGTIRLAPLIRGYVEAGWYDLDLESIDKALNTLNEAGSLHGAMTQLVMANSALEAARYAVGDITDLFTSGKGKVEVSYISSDGQRKKGIAPLQSEAFSVLLDGIAAHRDTQAFQSARSVMADEIGGIQKRFENDASERDMDIVREVRDADINTFKGHQRLVQISLKVGFPTGVELMAAGQSLAEWRQSLLARVGAIADSKLAEDGLPAGTLYSMVDPDGHQALVNNAEAEMAFYQDRYNELVEAYKKSEDEQSTQKPLNEQAAEKYGRYVAYMNALREYNDAYRFMASRAIGEFYYNDREHGLTFKDVSKENGRVDVSVAPKEVPMLLSKDPDVAFDQLSSVLGYRYYTAENTYKILSDSDSASSLPYQYTRPSRGRSPELYSIASNNADNRGKTSYEMYENLQMIEHVPNHVDQLYLLTGGFNIEIETTDDGVAKRRVENLGEIFQGWEFDSGSKAYQQTVKYDKDGREILPSPNDVIAAIEGTPSDLEEGRPGSYMLFLERTQDWINKTLELIGENDEIDIGNSGNFIGSINGMQTLAGQFHPLLKRRLEEAQAALDTHRKHVEDVLAKAKTGNKEAAIEFKDVMSDVLYQTRPETQVFRQALWNASIDVKLARVAFQAFLRPQWRSNVRREMSRTTRDAGFEPNETYKPLKELPVDVPTFNNYKWFLEMLSQKRGQYGVGAFYASDSLADLEKGNWSNDEFETWQSTETKWVKSQKVVDGEVVKDVYGNPVLEWKQVTASKDGFVFPQKQRDADGRPLPSPEMMADAPYDDNTEARSKRKVDAPDMIRRRWFTKTALLVGMRIRQNPTVRQGMADVDMADEFAHAFASISRDMKPKYVLNLIRDGLAGMFGISSDTDPILDRLNNEFHEQFPLQSGADIDPIQLMENMVLFKAMKEQALIDRARVKSPDLAAKALKTLVEEAVAGGRNPELLGESSRVAQRETTKEEFVSPLNKNKWDTRSPFPEEGSGLSVVAGTSVYDNSTEERTVVQSYEEPVAGVGPVGVDFTEESVEDVEVESRYGSRAERRKVKRSIHRESSATEDSALSDYEREMLMVGDSLFSLAGAPPNEFVSEDEIREIVMQLRRDMKMTSGPSKLFRAGVLKEDGGEHPFVSDNRMVNLLVHMLPGEVLIYSPAKPIYVGEVQLKTKIIPPRGDGPTVIYARPGASLSQGDASALIAAALKVHAEKTPAIADLVVNFAKDGMSKMSVISKIRQIETELKNSKIQYGMLAKAMAGKLIGDKDVDSALREAMTSKIRGHLINLARHVEFMNSTKDISFFVEGNAEESKTAGLYSSVTFISELLTNPSFKELYDQMSYDDGMIDVSGFDLSDGTLEAMLQAVEDINRSQTQDGENRVNPWEEGDDLGEDRQLEPQEGSEEFDQEYIWGEKFFEKGFDEENPFAGFDEFEYDSLELFHEGVNDSETDSVRDEGFVFSNEQKLGILQSKRRVDGLLRRMNFNPDLHMRPTHSLRRLIDLSREFGNPGLSKGDGNILGFLGRALAVANTKVQPFSEETQAKDYAYNKRSDVIARMYGAAENDYEKAIASAILPGVNSRSKRSFGRWDELLKLTSRNVDVDSAGRPYVARPTAMMNASRHDRMQAGLLAETKIVRSLMDGEFQRRVEDWANDVQKKEIEAERAVSLGVNWVYAPASPALMKQLDMVLPGARGRVTSRYEELLKTNEAIFERRSNAYRSLRNAENEKKAIEEEMEKRSAEYEEMIQNAVLKAGRATAETDIDPADLALVRDIIENIVQVVDDHITGRIGKASTESDKVATTFARLANNSEWSSKVKEIRKRLVALAKYQKQNKDNQNKERSMRSYLSDVNSLIESLENDINASIYYILGRHYDLSRIDNKDFQITAKSKLIKLPRVDDERANLGEVSQSVREAFNSDALASMLRPSLVALEKRGMSGDVAETILEETAKAEGRLSKSSQKARKLSKAPKFVKSDTLATEAKQNLDRLIDALVRRVGSTVSAQKRRNMIRQALENGFSVEASMDLPNGLVVDEKLFTSAIRALIPSRQFEMDMLSNSGRINAKTEARIEAVEKKIDSSRKELEAANKDIQRLIAQESTPIEVGWTKHVDDINEPHPIWKGKTPEMGVMIHLVPEGANTDSNAFNENKERAIREYASARRGEIGALVDEWVASSEAAVDGGVEIPSAPRFDFAAMSGAILGETGTVASRELDDTYRLLKGDSRYFNDTNPQMLIQNALEAVKVENDLIRERIDRARTEAQKVGMQHLGVDALTMLTAPDSGMDVYSINVAMEALTQEVDELNVELSKTEQDLRAALSNDNVEITEPREKELKRLKKRLAELRQQKINLGMQRQQKKRVSLWEMPASYDARRDLLGRIVDDGNGLVVLAATNAREDLAKRYMSQGKKPKTIESLILDALNPTLTGKDYEGNTVTRLDFPEDYLDAETDLDLTVVVDGKRVSTKGMTRREAGEVMEKSYRQQALEYVSPFMTGPKGEKGFKKNRKNGHEIKDEGYTKEALDRFSYMVRVMTHAYEHENISTNVRIKLGEWLGKLQAADSKGNQMDRHFYNQTTVEDMQTIDMFADVMADIEGSYIMDTLVSGLAINPNADHLKLLKWAHHEDARTRSRFIRSYVAMQEATRIRTLLDRGFNGQSGRNAAKVQYTDLAKDLSRHQKNIGNDSLDQSMGYVHASLEGILQTNTGSLSSNLALWISDFRKGVTHLRNLDQSQRLRFGNPLKRFIHAQHVDLIRDLKMVEEIERRLGKHMDKFMAGADSFDFASQEKFAKEIITAMKQEMERSDKKNEIRSYSEALVNAFNGLTDAMTITKALMSQKPKQEEGGTIAKAHKREKSAKVSFTSTVPLKFHYASNPNESAADRAVNEEGRIEDPIDIVKLEDSSLYGGVGRHDKKKGRTPYRPINLNGLSAVDGLIEDALYRLHVAPTYSVLRFVIGREEKSDHNVSLISEDAKIIRQFSNINDWQSSKSREREALAAVARELERVIANDSQQGVYNTQLGEASRFLSSVYTVKALFSVLQLWNQTAPAILFTTIKKLVTGDAKSAGEFLKIASRMLDSGVRGNVLAAGNEQARGELFFSKVDAWVKKADPWISFRGTDGMDPYRNILRKQMRYGNNPVKAVLGNMAKRIEAMGEWGMDKTIGVSERWVARSMYMMELLGELRRMEDAGVIKHAPRTVDALLEIDGDLIPQQAKDYARMKVNDMMGVADQSKKAAPFQSLSKSPGTQALLRSGVRFSNHTATTASNMTALLPALWSLGDDAGYGAKRMRREALENVVGTIGQNIAFHLMKAHVMLSLVSYVIFKGMGDDDDEAQFKAQELSDKMLVPDEEMNKVSDYIKAAIFGGEKQLFQDWRDPDSARRSAYADLLGKSFTELAQAIPMVGVLVGYSPVAIASKSITDSFAEHIMAIGEDMEVARGNMAEEGVRIYERDRGPIERASMISAPTMELYNLFDAGRTASKSLFLENSNPIETAAYLATEVFAPREMRSFLEGRLKKKIRDEE